MWLGVEVPWVTERRQESRALPALSTPFTSPSHLRNLIITTASVFRATDIQATIERASHALSLSLTAIPYSRYITLILQ